MTEVNVVLTGEKENLEAFCRRVRRDASLYEIRFQRSTEEQKEVK